MTSTDTYRSPPTFAEWAESEIELRFWREALENLEAERRQAEPEAIKAAHDFAIRAAAVDTAAIEGLYQVDRGFTFSVAAQTGAWEHYFDERGDKAREVFEDQLRAFELVLDAATSQFPVVEALIRSLHELVCASQDTYRVLTEQGWQEQELVRGEYKRYPNNPRLPDGRQHHYAPPLQVKEEMERLIVELGSPAFAAAPAPVQAAYAHFAFVTIHPFPDGNGRVARALSSIYLVRATSVPFVVFADQKPGYLDALAEADRGGLGEFSEYVRDRSMDAIELAQSSLLSARATPPQDLRSQASRVLFTGPGVSHSDADQAARRLAEQALSHAQRAFNALALPEGVVLASSLVDEMHKASLEGYRSIQNQPGYARLTVIVSAPSKVEKSIRLLPVVSLDPERAYLIGLLAEEGPSPRFFGARYEDTAPNLSAALEVRLTQWLHFVISSLVAKALELTKPEEKAVILESGFNLARLQHIRKPQ